MFQFKRTTQYVARSPLLCLFPSLFSEGPLKEEEVEISQEMHAGSHVMTEKRPPARPNNDSKTDSEEDTEHLSTVQSVSSSRSAAASGFNGLASSRSTVVVGEEHLTRDPVEPEVARRTREDEEESAAQRLVQRAERKRQEVERKRREREEEERKQQEREETEETFKSELNEERRRRAEDFRSYFFLQQ